MRTFTLLSCVALISTLLLASAAATSTAFDHTHGAWGAVLGRYLTTTGKQSTLDYLGLSEDGIAEVEAYLNQLSKVDDKTFQKFTRDEKLAFLLNAYNAATVRLVVQHYPKTSIQQIPDAFDLTAAKLLGKDMSLNDIENKRIRSKEFNEPRIHAALVCAAQSCPPLRDEPYIAAKLDAQLDDQMATFLGDKTKNFLDRETDTFYASSIFRWFRKDFRRKLKGPLQAYIQQYQPDIRRTSNIRYLPYNWLLNDTFQDAPQHTVERVSSNVPWPRGLVYDQGSKKLFALARGRARKGGGPDRSLTKFENAGAIYELSLDIKFDPLDPTKDPRKQPPSEAVERNGTVIAKADKRVFRTYTVADPARDDIEADRPYTSLVYDLHSKNFFITGFSGIDGVANHRRFRKNATDSILRYSTRAPIGWYMVERHRGDIVPQGTRRNPDQVTIPNAYYPHFGGGSQSPTSRPVRYSEMRPPATPNPPMGWLNGPDGLHVTTRVIEGHRHHWLYAVAKDNHRLVCYDISPMLDRVDAMPPTGEIAVEGSKLKTQDGFDVLMRGYSAIAEFGNHLYLGSRTDGNIVRFELDATGRVDRKKPEFVAALGGGKDLIDIAFNDRGELFASLSSTKQIWLVGTATASKARLTAPPLDAAAHPAADEAVEPHLLAAQNEGPRPYYSAYEKISNLVAVIEDDERVVYFCSNSADGKQFYPANGHPTKRATAGAIYRLTFKDSRIDDASLAADKQVELLNLTAPDSSNFGACARVSLFDGEDP